MVSNTELNLVYEYIDLVRNREHNLDEPITESLMRHIMSTYRGNILHTHYKKGVNISDEVVQSWDMEFTKKGNFFSAKIPKTIRFQNNAGIFLEYYGYNIPVMESEAFELGVKNTFGKKTPKAKTVNDELIVYLPPLSDCIMLAGTLVQLVKASKNNKFSATFSGVLVYPGDCPTYNWEKDAYPFPGEKLDQLKYLIASRDFGISAQFKKDEVQNARQDNVIYQDEFNIEE
mgnify:CR=1 FL=1